MCVCIDHGSIMYPINCYVINYYLVNIIVYVTECGNKISLELVS